MTSFTILICKDSFNFARILEIPNIKVDIAACRQNFDTHSILLKHYFAEENSPSPTRGTQKNFIVCTSLPSARMPASIYSDGVKGPTPEGVPVKIRSPFSKRITELINAKSSGILVVPKKFLRERRG